jgi:diguanylate cyclase (GGDEF)-like protein/PAS domain S-box-containing protein
LVDRQSEEVFMDILDMRTVLIGYAISNLICAAVMFSLWRQNRQRFAGIGLWAADFVLQFVGLVLVALRGSVPELLSTTGSNMMILGGTVLLYLGLGRFTGRRNLQWPNYALLAAYLPVHAYFVVVLPNLRVRNILFSLALLALCAQCAWLTLRGVSAAVRPTTRGVGQVFVAFCLISLIRIIVDLAIPPGDDLFRANVYDTLLLLTYQMLFVVLTFTLFLVANRRLFLDLEIDIAAREQAEAALRSSEEKFFKAFQGSPDAILISRLGDGKFVEVNEGFSRLTGYSRQEALHSTSLDLGVWASADDRGRVVSELRQQGRVRDLEYGFRHRSGAVRQCLYSGEIIDLGGEPHVLSVVRDITERKRTERIIGLRLMLWEIAAAHPIDELMQRALDQIEDLTESAISFYHLVEDDQETLSLQAWSSRTLAEFCTAEGKGMHYPISQAGVWVDCFHKREPVIHNDYASLPHRKGLPEGHAEVFRELVVPTLRDGRVVALLGVGNKPSEYDGQDVELVSYLADLVWSILERKRSDEQVRDLNTRLEHLAMTDDLTGLTNRRSFFIRGNNEIRRSERYRTPLSLLVLDLDRFKAVNDRFGHQAGDKMLKCIADTLLRNVREVDTLARLGGEEFGVLLPNTGSEDAARLAERLRAAVEEADCQVRNRKMQVTVSIGVASYRKEMPNLDAILKDADSALYRAKSRGRNQVSCLD